MMTGLLPFKSVPTTAVVLSALCAGAGLAEAATYLQTNLVSDIPGLATLTDPNLTNTWGVSSFRQSLLDLEPRRQYIKSLRGDRQHRRQQAKFLPGEYRGHPNIRNRTAQGPTGQVANSGTSFGISGGRMQVCSAPSRASRKLRRG